MSMTYLKTVLFAKKNIQQKDRSAAVVSDKLKFSVKELFAKRTKGKTVQVIENAPSSLLPTKAVIARSQKGSTNFVVDPGMVEAMQSVFDALHDPSLLDARRNRRYNLYAPFIIPDSQAHDITTRQHEVMRAYCPTRQITTTHAVQTVCLSVPSLDTSSAVNEASSWLDTDIIEVMRIPRLEAAQGMNGSLISEISMSRSNLSVGMSSKGTDLILASTEQECSHPAPSGRRVMDTEDMKIIRFLGEGTTGKVYFAKDQVSRARVALKVVEKKDKNEYTLSTIVQEVDILERLSDSPWFVQLYSSWHDRDYMYIAMTPYPSDLDSELIRLVKIEPTRARFYIAEIIIALTELHKRGIIHRDVKAPNILIDRQGHVVLADFGLSMDFYYPPSIAERVYQPYWPYLPDEYADSNTEERDPRELYFVAWDYRGSELEMAPEIHLRQPYSFGVDFWSAAVVLYWMLTGRPPWYEREDCSDLSIEVDDKPLAFKIAEDDLVFLPSDEVDEVTQDFLQKMLVKNPKKRLMIDFEMPNHPYFAGINWPLLEARTTQTPWVPEYDICHVYEPSTPVFTPGKPYSDHENPWPSFTYLSKQAGKRIIYEECDNINYDTDEEEFDEFAYDEDLQDEHEHADPTPTNNTINDEYQSTRDVEDAVLRSPTSQYQGSSTLRVDSDTNATERDTSIITDTSTSQGSSILPTTPKQYAPFGEGWDVTIISPSPTAPYSPGPKQWLHAQDLLRLQPKHPATVATVVSSTASTSSLEIMYAPVQPPGVSQNPTSVDQVPESISLQAYTMDFTRLPEQGAPTANASGLLSKAKAWWMSKRWTPKPKKSMGVKRLSC